MQKVIDPLIPSPDAMSAHKPLTAPPQAAPTLTAPPKLWPAAADSVPPSTIQGGGAGTMQDFNHSTPNTILGQLGGIGDMGNSLMETMGALRRNPDESQGDFMLRSVEAMGMGMSLHAPEAKPFFSQLSKTLEEKVPNYALPHQILDIAKAGSKAEEMHWSGLEDWLKSHPGKVAKTDLMEFMRGHELKLHEVLKGKGAPSEPWSVFDTSMGADRADAAHFATREQAETWLNDRVADQVAVERVTRGQFPDPDLDSLEDYAQSIYEQFAVEPSPPGTAITHGLHADEIDPALQQRARDANGPVNAALRDNDMLGFDTMAQARGAIFQHPDWVDRWDPDPGLIAAGNEFREAHIAVNNEKARIAAMKTKFDQYQLDGPKENYREMLLTLPEKPTMDDLDGDGASPRGWGSVGGRDTANFRGEHYDEPNILAHVRFNDRIDPVTGKKMLFIEEIQSDWHQKARKAAETETKRMLKDPDYVGPREASKDFGYAIKDPTLEAQIDAANKAHNETADAAWRTKQEMKEAYRDHPYDPSVRARVAQKVNEAEAANNAAYATLMDLHAKAKRGFVPDAPFKSNWHELAMKRMIRHAAENGYDQIGWTTGAQQVARYEDELRKSVDSIRYFMGNKAHEVSAVKNGKEVFVAEFDENGRSLRPIHKGEHVSMDQVVGKDIASQIMNGTGKLSGGSRQATWEGKDLTIGGEGMKGFYDRMLPRFVDSYGKKWGVKVGQAGIDAEQAMGWKSRYEGPLLTEEQLNDVRWGPATYERNNNNGDWTWDVTYRDQLDEVIAAMDDRGLSFEEAMRTEASPGLARLLGGDMVRLPPEPTTVHAIDITPEMTKSVLQKGQPLFTTIPPMPRANQQDKKDRKPPPGGDNRRQALASQLTDVYGRSQDDRSRVQPKAFGSFRELGSPGEFVPDMFPKARQAEVEWSHDQWEPANGGAYHPFNNKIEINSLDKDTREDRAGRLLWAPGTLPHETGHAIWEELTRPISAKTDGKLTFSSDSPEFTKAMSVLMEWQGLHAKLLGKGADGTHPFPSYQYKNEPPHSFADAWGAYVTSPAELKKEFPEIYSFFTKLSGIEYRRDKPLRKPPPR